MCVVLNVNLEAVSCCRGITSVLISQGIVGREPFPLPAVPAPGCLDTSESYYEEAQPYEETINGKNSQVLVTICVSHLRVLVVRWIPCVMCIRRIIWCRFIMENASFAAQCLCWLDIRWLGNYDACSLTRMESYRFRTVLEIHHMSHTVTDCDHFLLQFAALLPTVTQELTCLIAAKKLLNLCHISSVH